MNVESSARAHGRAEKRKRALSPPTLKERHLAELRTLPAAWLASWKEVFKGDSIGPDLLAGLTVAAVALPLNLALAVACGLPPEAGLIAGAVGGGLAALFGGAPLQVTGPAAALNVMVLAIALDYGVAGAAAAALITGALQIVLSLALAGKLARFVPEAVLAGFTTGVGVKLLDQQLPELMGFDYRVSELLQKLGQPQWLHEVSWIAVLSGLFVALGVVGLQKYKRVPAALLGVVFVTMVSVYVGWDVERVGTIPSTMPAPGLPQLTESQWLDLLVRSLPLGLLAAVESLLSAKAVDRMRGGVKPHNANLELFGQGVANLGAGLFSGLTVSGVIVRSGVNVQSGARTRVAALVHAVALLTAMLYLYDQIALIPLAALSGLLCVVGMRLIEVGTLVHLLKSARVEALAFVVTAAGTLTGHLMAGLVAGLVIAGLGHLLSRRHERPAPRPQAPGVRAVLDRHKAEARRPAIFEPAPAHHNWLQHVRERAQVAASAFVHGQASVIGKVVLGEHVHIAAGSSVRADEGTPFFIGANTNIQDGVVIHALKERKVVVGGEDWAVFIGRNVSVAHDALVHGPCFIGDDTFVGFKAVVHDSIVGAHCYIGIGAVVVGVEVPDGKYVPHGTIVDSADAVDALPDVTEAHREFNEDVVDVNRGLARAYNTVASNGPRALPAPASTRLLRSDNRF